MTALSWVLTHPKDALLAIFVAVLCFTGMGWKIEHAKRKHLIEEAVALKLQVQAYQDTLDQLAKDGVILKGKVDQANQQASATARKGTESALDTLAKSDDQATRDWALNKIKDLK